MEMAGFRQGFDLIVMANDSIWPVLRIELARSKIRSREGGLLRCDRSLLWIYLRLSVAQQYLKAGTFKPLWSSLWK
jgi:hypothetical protein